MRQELKALIVSAGQVQETVEALRRYGYDPRWHVVASVAEVREALAEGEWDVVLCDYLLPGFNAMMFMEMAREAGLEAPIIVLSDVPGEETAVATMKAGASDYVMRGNLGRLGPAVEREVKEARRRREERRRQEESLQSQRLESIGRLAGGVAHDFNNMLTAVIGYTHLALTSLPPEHKARRDLQEIQRAAQKAADLTRQLLAFSRQDVVKPKVLDLNQVIADITGMLRRLIGEDIEMVTLPGQGLRPIKMDPVQLEQVIVNLVVNARDAMPGGGTLIIETANVTLDEELVRHEPDLAPGEYVMLAIRDTGIGIPQEVLEHIFEPFFTTKGDKGTGLGLSTCYGIVKQNKGHIAVDSAPDQGTTFRIFLPVCLESALWSGQEVEEHALAPVAPATVLLVEDDMSLRRLAERVLEEQGYRVLSAGNGVEALRLLERQGTRQLDLVVTDVLMPLMGGKELGDRVRESYPGVRILYTSGYTDSIIMNRGMLTPDSDFLYKPYTPADLLKKVRQILESAS